MPAFHIRNTGESEAEMLAAIHEECFPNYWDSSAFTDFFSVAGTHALLAEAPGTKEPVAMIVYRVQFEQADIITLAVRPAWRRQGIARALAQQSLAHMRDLGGQTVFLDVEDGNSPAISLYETMGFSHERRRKLYYRQKDGSYTDALVMKKKIA